MARCFSQSGVPPDYFSDSAPALRAPPVYPLVAASAGRFQLVGRRRLAAKLQLFDLLPPRPFRALEPTGTCRRRRPGPGGPWRRSPGHALFGAACWGLAMDPCRLIGRSLGRDHAEVEALRDALPLPSMEDSSSSPSTATPTNAYSPCQLSG